MLKLTARLTFERIRMGMGIDQCAETGRDMYEPGNPFKLLTNTQIHGVSGRVRTGETWLPVGDWE